MKKMLLRGALLITAVSMVLVNNAVAGWIFQDEQLDGPPHYEVVDGIEWLFTLTNGEASIGYNYYERGGLQPDGSITSVCDWYLPAVMCTNATCLRVPRSLAGCPVRAIKPYAFGYSQYNIQSITIPACVTNIGERAIYCCYNLERIMFEGAPPDGVVDRLKEILSDKYVCIYYNEKYDEEWCDVINEAWDEAWWLWEYAWEIYKPAPSIDFVTARQRYPWNGKVDIEYTVWGDIDAKAREEGSIPSLKVYAVDQAMSTTNIATELSGDMSLSEGTHKIVWDMNAQGLDIKSTNVVFHVACKPEPWLYCIIDLSAGSSATNYPVSYTNEIPSGSWSDEYKTTKLVLRRIPAGTFTMGARSTDYPGASDYGIHQVALTKDYWMGVFEVTQRQWELVMGTRPSYFTNGTCYAARPVEQVSYDMIRGSSAGAGWPNSSAVDAKSFLGVIRQKSGLMLDLPTEAQWEYACRAGTTTALNSGKNLTNEYQDAEMGKVGRYLYNGGWPQNQSSDTSGGTAKVGSYLANNWGLYDMHGNVYELCLDWYGAYQGDATNPIGPESGSRRVMRGGFWRTAADLCRSSQRTDTSPEHDFANGFRLALTISNNLSDSGCSDPVRIDLTTGMRTAAVTETITYSTNWVDGVGADAIAEVAVDGVVISSEARTGTVEWTPTHNGTYALTHKVLAGGSQVGETLTATFIVAGIVPVMPVISPASGTIFDTSLTVSMTCATTNATIHYTTDGTIPTLESPAYVKKFRIYGKTTINAIAFLEDGAASKMAVAQYAYGGQCKDPVIRPHDGTVFLHSGQVVSIAWERTNGVLRCTTDGSDPTNESPKYAGPFTIDDTTTIKAKVFGDTYFDSQIVTATLTRAWATVETPVVTAQAQFTGSKAKVRLSCATEGAVIHYTTDGSVPNENSPVYSAPFYLTESSTVKAYAVCYDYLDSAVASFTTEKVWGIGDTLGKPDHKFETSGDAGFVRVVDTTATLGESMKSGTIADNQTSVLSTKITGSGTLTFKWKTSCEEDEVHEWDRAEFAVDGVVTNVLDGVTEWVEVSQRIEGDGEHTVTWTYVKDNVEFEGEDCMWVSDYDWETDLTETQTTTVPVPYDWLLEKSRDAVDEYDIYEKVAKQTAYNPRFTVEQCYVAGLDPESTTNEFTATIGPDLAIGWKPDLKAERNYKVWGSTNLVNGGDWEWPTNALHRFFKVTVEMP